MSVRKFYVYVDRTIDGRPFYVGKGCKRRVADMSFRNSLHENISKKHGFDRKIEFSDLTEEEAFNKERELIKSYNTFARTGWGANLTLGGDGTSGRKISDKHKKKLSEVNSHKKSDETRERMKLAAQQRAKSEEWREKMSIASKARWQNDDYRLKFVGRKRTLEQKERMSAAQTRRYQGEKNV